MLSQCNEWLKHMQSSKSDREEWNRISQQNLPIQEIENYTRKVSDKLQKYIELVQFKSSPIFETNPYCMIGGYMKERIEYLKQVEKCRIEICIFIR